MAHSRTVKLLRIALVSLLVVYLLPWIGSPLVARVSAFGSHATRTTALPLRAGPTPSGAASAYPLNETFDADVQPTGTPPTNYTFEAPPQTAGTPPTNSDFSQPPGIAGTPPANYNFATGTFANWTNDGGTIHNDATHGYYADLNWNTITSSPFTIDPSTQTFTFDVFYLPNTGSAMYVYLLSGANYSTSTQMSYLFCWACNTWRTESIDITNFRGQSVEIRFQAYYSEIGVTNAKGTNLCPGWTVSGNASRTVEGSGNA